MAAKTKKYVVVRSSQSGVWFGVLTAPPLVDGPGTVQVNLDEARKAWQWQGAAATSGLATRGPASGKITEPIDGALVAGCCEVLPASKDAVARWARVSPWVA